jgi:hypothetical protein
MEVADSSETSVSTHKTTRHHISEFRQPPVLRYMLFYVCVMTYIYIYIKLGLYDYVPLCIHIGQIVA